LNTEPGGRTFWGKARQVGRYKADVKRTCRWECTKKKKKKKK